jgi:predicted metallo-beta-lactamase superfamily hydrolase
MCTYVETPDVRVLIDAGVALGLRFGKLPHPREYQARDHCRAKIREFAAKADIVVVSHYHNDHHTPNYCETVYVGSSLEESEQIYQDKIVLLKDIRNSINFSQRRRGWMFQKFLTRIGGKCEIADGRTFEYGATLVRISEPVPHGEEESELGWVIMTAIESGDEKLLHASDVQGPMAKQTTRMILKESPHLLILGGPPVYLEGVKVDKGRIRKGMDNAAKIVRKVPKTVLEHHLLRVEDWRDRAKPVYDIGKQVGHDVTTGAEYAGEKLQVLEAIRPRLYEEEPPSEAFVKWSKMKRDKQRNQWPPLD